VVNYVYRNALAAFLCVYRNALGGVPWTVMLASLLPLLLIPLSLALELMSADPLWVFAVGAAGIIPLSTWIRRATEQVAERAGPAIGGLLNVTFGNAAEFILALFVFAPATLPSSRRRSPAPSLATVSLALAGRSWSGRGDGPGRPSIASARDCSPAC
jgi:Ca2+/H+ antiporter